MWLLAALGLAFQSEEVVESTKGVSAPSHLAWKGFFLATLMPQGAESQQQLLRPPDVSGAEAQLSLMRTASFP